MAAKRGIKLNIYIWFAYISWFKKKIRHDNKIIMFKKNSFLFCVKNNFTVKKIRGR